MNLVVKTCETEAEMGREAQERLGIIQWVLGTKERTLFTTVKGRARKSRSELLKNSFHVVREYWIAVRITEYMTGRKGRRRPSQGERQPALPSKRGRWREVSTLFPFADKSAQ